MFKRLFFLLLIVSIALSACGTLEVSLDQTPTPAIDAGQVATMVAATLAALPSATSMSIPTLIPTENITPTTDDFPTGWKTYSNEIYGFTFKYPSDKFNLLGDNACASPIIISAACRDKNYIPGDNLVLLQNTLLPPDNGSQATAANGWLWYEIAIMPVEPNTLVADWVRKNWLNQENDIQSNINMDGIEAIKFQKQDFEPKSNVYVFLIKNNNLIKISGHYLNFQNSRYYQQIKMTWMDMTDKFLTTFKFTK